jgi:hypothetical protein
MKPVSSRTRVQADEVSAVRSLPEGGAGNTPAWEMVEIGRYMPRRIRGSFRGRELG